jgi:hypothetical protein
MNNNYFDKNGRIQEVRYDPVPTDERSLSLEPERREKPAREGTTHAAKLASLSILFALVFVIGSVAYIVNNRSQTAQTQASILDLYGPQKVAEDEKLLTAGVAEYPLRYKGRPIPKNLVSEGNKKYSTLPKAERKVYIINRIVLYYIYSDVLSMNNIQYNRPSLPLTFDGIEQTMPEIVSTMKREYPQPELFVNEYLSRFSY